MKKVFFLSVFFTLPFFVRSLASQTQIYPTIREDGLVSNTSFCAEGNPFLYAWKHTVQTIPTSTPIVIFDRNNYDYNVSLTCNTDHNDTGFLEAGFFHQGTVTPDGEHRIELLSGTRHSRGDEYQLFFTAQRTNGVWTGVASTTASSSPNLPSCTTNCYSNIMFFPGIMGSKLYEETDNNKVWDSAIDSEQAKLIMDTNGYSINNIHTSASTTHATEGVIPEILGGNIYKSFMSDLSQMKVNNTIQDYALIPYDWRLPLSEIVAKGNVQGDKVYYGTPVSNLQDSFIIKELQKLADTSKSGKVTIIAHSNGGLVTKELIQTLKETNNPLWGKIDKVIFVGVPQVGTPEAVTTLLHGSNIGPLGVYVNAQRTRDLFLNMPSMYNLLPSEAYVDDLSPLIEFNSTTMLAQGMAYGSTINTYQEYLEYLQGTEGRTNPIYEDTMSPAKANQALLQNAITTHQRLDSWLPATSTKVYQVAGWGIYTPSGIKYSDNKTCVTTIGSTICTTYDTKITISDQFKLNGDGTVLSGSAQMMGESDQVESWWVDVKEYNKGITRDREHKDILEIDPLRNFIKNLTVGSSLDTTYLSRTEPTNPNEPYTTYKIHSPLHLSVIDNLSNITGYSTSTGQILEQIKGSQYVESADVKTVILPQNIPHTVYLTAYNSGSFTFESSTLTGNTESNISSIEAIPTQASTTATLTNPGTAVGTSTPLVLDFDSDGTIDRELSFVQNTVYTYHNETSTTVIPTTQDTPTTNGGSGTGYYTPKEEQQSIPHATSTPVIHEAPLKEEVLHQATTTQILVTNPKPTNTRTLLLTRSGTQNKPHTVEHNVNSNNNKKDIQTQQLQPKPPGTTPKRLPLLERIIYWVKGIISNIFN